MLRHGIVNGDDSVDQTGHKQVPIQYDKTLFQVEDESGSLLEEITVDESMVDLLKAVWRHGIPTNHLCQGSGNGNLYQLGQGLNSPKDAFATASVASITLAYPHATKCGIDVLTAIYYSIKSNIFIID